jgi:hypothetical protein
MTASYRSEHPKIRPLVLAAVRPDDRPAGTGRAQILAFPGRRAEIPDALPAGAGSAPVAPALSLVSAPTLFLMGAAAMALARLFFWAIS